MYVTQEEAFESECVGPTDLGIIKGDIPTRKCAASDCKMGWRWEPDAVNAAAFRGDHAPLLHRGYCGLAGKPE